MRREPKLDGVRTLPREGYLLTWEDGFALTVDDKFGLDLLTNLDQAQQLRRQRERGQTKEERYREALEEIKRVGLGRTQRIAREALQ